MHIKITVVLKKKKKKRKYPTRKKKQYRTTIMTDRNPHTKHREKRKAEESDRE